MTTTKAEAQADLSPLEANPSLGWLIPVAVLSVVTGLVCILPILLMLAGTFGIGGIKPDFGTILVAFPVAGVAAFMAAAGWAAIGDLLLPRPVLTIDEGGLFDRRVVDAPVPWAAIKEVTVLPRGSVVLELNSPMPSRLNPYRTGTVFYQRPDADLLVIPIRAMSVPAATLAAAILLHAEAHGAVVGARPRHERLAQIKFF